MWKPVELRALEPLLAKEVAAPGVRLRYQD